MCDLETEQCLKLRKLGDNEPKHSPLCVLWFKTKSPLSCHTEQSIAALVPMPHDEQPVV